MSSSKMSSWHNEIDARRKGAGYFLSQGGRLRFEPAEYVAFRAVSRAASDALILEWVQWLRILKNSRYEHVRRAAAAASPLTQAHLDEYYKGRLLKTRALTAMESSIEQVTAADSKVTELLYKEFDGKPSELNSLKSVASDTLLFNEEGRLAEEGYLLDAAAVHAHGILPVDDKESCATVASRPVKNRRKRASQQSSATSAVESAEAKQRRTERRTRRHGDLDRSKFWELASSGRCVEDVLFDAAVSGHANVKVRSYTIDFGCERTRALFSEAEWEEMKAYNQFSLPKLPKSTAQYLMAVRNAFVSDEHPASAAVPREDRYSCDLILRTVLSWTSLYAEEPSAFANSALTEAFWCCEAWPLLKNLLSDVHGISMIDGEKQGTESARHRNHERRADLERATPRKRGGAKLDLVAHDSINKRDWFVVESPKEWDQHSTKFLEELSVKLFRNLHLIATHRLAEEPSADFCEEARFFSIYAGGRGFITMEIRPCPISQYVMLTHTYDEFTLPATTGSWTACMKATIAKYTECARQREAAATESNNGSDDDSWLYRLSQRRHVYDLTLCSSPIGPEDDDPLV
ncbi:hypothetical protein BGZ51_001343 [Haplosporangium sp. Z 767]|nr:hypothetical protein BGZ51_001343 [Haplosporangium sp. Z 767]